jgi:3-oxoacyl-[acyl-carrier-protein] synthase III
MKENIESGKIDIAHINHVIVSSPLMRYKQIIAKEFGISDKSFASVDGESGDPHTSALAVGYNNGILKNIFKDNDLILFVGAAYGLTCACGVYKQ